MISSGNTGPGLSTRAATWLPAGASLTEAYSTKQRYPKHHFTNQHSKNPRRWHKKSYIRSDSHSRLSGSGTVSELRSFEQIVVCKARSLPHRTESTCSLIAPCAPMRRNCSPWCPARPVRSTGARAGASAGRAGQREVALVAFALARGRSPLAARPNGGAYGAKPCSTSACSMSITTLATDAAGPREAVRLGPA